MQTDDLSKLDAEEGAQALTRLFESRSDSAGVLKHDLGDKPGEENEVAELLLSASQFRPDIEYQSSSRDNLDGGESDEQAEADGVAILAGGGRIYGKKRSLPLLPASVKRIRVEEAETYEDDQDRGSSDVDMASQHNALPSSELDIGREIDVNGRNRMDQQMQGAGEDDDDEDENEETAENDDEEDEEDDDIGQEEDEDEVREAIRQSDDSKRSLYEKRPSVNGAMENKNRDDDEDVEDDDDEEVDDEDDEMDYDDEEPQPRAGEDDEEDSMDEMFDNAIIGSKGHVPPDAMVDSALADTGGDGDNDVDSGLHPRMLRRVSLGMSLNQEKPGAGLLADEVDPDAKLDGVDKERSSDSESDEKDDRDSEDELQEEEEEDDGVEDVEAEENQDPDEENLISGSIEVQTIEREFNFFKEELYNRRSRLLDQEQALIQEGIHPDYLQQLEEMEARFVRRRKVWENWKEMKLGLIERQFESEREKAESDFMEARRAHRQEHVGVIYSKMQRLEREFESDIRQSPKTIEPALSRIQDFHSRKEVTHHQIKGRITQPWCPSYKSALAATLLPKRLGPRGTDPEVAHDMLVIATMTADIPRKPAEQPRKFEHKPLPEQGSLVHVEILDGPGAGGYSARVWNVTPSEILLKKLDGSRTRVSVASLRSGRIIIANN